MTFQWTLGGTFFNAQTNAVLGVTWPTCSTVPYVDSSLLRSNQTTAWWVSGGAGDNTDPNTPAVYTVSLSCTLLFTNGNPQQQFAPQGQFNMYRPQAKITTSTTSVNVLVVRGQTQLIFATPSNPGITFSNIIVYPTNFPGETTWVQVDLSTAAQCQDTNSTNHITVQNGPNPYLDSTWPYSTFLNGNPVDSPADRLDNLPSKYVKLTDSDSFEMWMLFQPNVPGHLVPLRAVNWSWCGSATNSPSGWGFQTGTNSVNPPDFNVEIYPLWKSNVTNFTWQPAL